MSTKGPAAGSLIEELAVASDSSILLAVIDGLGDIPSDELGGLTPLEAASTPVMDGLAGSSALGLHVPVAHGITPGSGPAHLALFGYDPVEYRVGRGVLSALGIGFDLRAGDLAARINFCTVDGTGTVTDRRAGRISTDKCRELVGILSGIRVEGAEVFVEPVKEHRACVVFRGEGLDDAIPDTDPGLTGMKPHPVRALAPQAERAAAVVRRFADEAARVLKDLSPANQILLRGFALHRSWRSIGDRFGLKAAAIALYPMYRGVASLVGMDVMEVQPEDPDGEAAAAARALAGGYTFVFVHHKPADSAGEDGDPAAKVRAIEAFDAVLPRLLDAAPDVLCITGDHSTPCSMKLHSWHPVPFMIHGGPQRTGCSRSFSERAALTGAVGTLPASDLMAVLMASAGKLAKYGA